MKNIIFLDIDGVLNDNTCYLSLESIEILKQLIQSYNAKIVTITSWQMNGTENRRKKIKYQLKQQGIYNINFIDPNFKGNLCDIRLLGIVDYLKKYLISNSVILDDDYQNDYKLLYLNHYRTIPFKGLTYKIKFKPVNLNNFKYINYKHKQLGDYKLVTNNLIKVLKKL